MKPSLSIALLAATMFMAAPAIHTLSPFTAGHGGQAYAAGNGNGGGNGNSGGNGGSRGNSGDHAQGNSGGAGKAGAAKDSSASGKKAASNAEAKPPKKPAKTTKVASAAKTAKAATPPKTKNIHAQLKGLNSLKRNINGMMNSADPRMAAIRAYITAAGTLQAATTAYDKAKADTASAQSTLNDLNDQKTELQKQIDANPDDAALKTQMAELDQKIAEATQALTDAQAAEASAKTAYDAAATAADGVVTEANLEAAIAAAESPNTTLDANALNWAKDQVNRLVNDYAATQI